MGTWRVSADLLARARFQLSVRAEVTAAIDALLAPRDPAERAFHAAHGAAFGAMLAEHPVRARVLACSRRRRRGSRPGWVAQYLSEPPAGTGTDIVAELDAVAATPEAELRRDLEETSGGPLPTALAGAALTDAAVELMSWVWTHTVETDWARRERILRADIVARTARLATHGWSAVLRDLGRGREWVGDGQLRINRFDLPSRSLPDDAQLLFVPITSHASWVGWHEPDRYAVYYPVIGRLAEAPLTRSGLPRLIGGNRAAVLTLLGEPASTTQLAALTGLPIGSIGTHLRVLLDAGAVEHRRSGRDVLYWRTALGDALVAAGGSARLAGS